MRASLLVLFALSLTGCATIQPKPVIEQRFLSAPGASKVVPKVTLSVATAPSESAASGIKITELGDRAQAALITATKGSPPPRIMPKGDGPSGVELRNTESRVFVVSVRFDKFLAPGDRVDAMQYSLKVDNAINPDWKITGWCRGI